MIRPLVCLAALALQPAFRAASAEPPVVVLIGDSIRLGYAPFVQEQLEGEAKVLSFEPNGGDSANVLAHLEEWAIEPRPAVIHLNAGLHDLRFDPEAMTHQVELKDYRRNLARILDRLEAETDAVVIFATTTPVIEERHNAVKPFHRLNADVQAYNHAAMDLIAERPGVQVNDLHGFVKDLGPEAALVKDGVHFTDEASRKLAEQVSAAIRQALVERD